MQELTSPIIVLPGADGHVMDLSMLRAGRNDRLRFDPIEYPGWSRYISNEFSANALISDLTEQIAARVPRGPIRIVGYSIGGHLGYAAALRLQAEGREIGGFCAIDSLITQPRRLWGARATAQGLELLRQRRFRDFVYVVHSLIWRALIRITSKLLPGLLRGFSMPERPRGSELDLETELSMHLLLQKLGPWISSLDREPVALRAPTILLRSSAAGRDDEAWRRRCPDVKIYEVAGTHSTLFEARNIASLRDAFIEATRDWR